MAAPTAAAASASAAAPSITRRNADTNASSTASRTASRFGDSIDGTADNSAPAIFGSSRSIAARSDGVNARRARRGRTRASNVWTSTTPNTAMASSPATRATALLIPDATPARPLSTALITVVVSGATVIAMPNPTTTTAGKNVVQYEPPIPGRAYKASPSAASAGPTVSGTRVPMRATSPPDHRESANMITGNGRTAAPAAVGV